MDVCDHNLCKNGFCVPILNNGFACICDDYHTGFYCNVANKALKDLQKHCKVTSGIIGGVLGAIILLLLIIGFIYYRRNKKKEKDIDVQYATYRIRSIQAERALRQGQNSIERQQTQHLSDERENTDYENFRSSVYKNYRSNDYENYQTCDNYIIPRAQVTHINSRPSSKIRNVYRLNDERNRSSMSHINHGQEANETIFQRPRNRETGHYLPATLSGHSVRNERYSPYQRDSEGFQENQNRISYVNTKAQATYINDISLHEIKSSHKLHDKEDGCSCWSHTRYYDSDGERSQNHRNNAIHPSSFRSSKHSYFNKRYSSKQRESTDCKKNQSNSLHNSSIIRLSPCMSTPLPDMRDICCSYDEEGRRPSRSHAKYDDKGTGYIRRHDNETVPDLSTEFSGKSVRCEKNASTRKENQNNYQNHRSELPQNISSSESTNSSDSSLSEESCPSRLHVEGDKITFKSHMELCNEDDANVKKYSEPEIDYHFQTTSSKQSARDGRHLPKRSESIIYRNYQSTDCCNILQAKMNNVNVVD